MMPDLRAGWMRLVAVLQSVGITPGQLDRALACKDSGLQDEIAAVIRRYADKAIGIITPVRAEDSGLIPKGYSVHIREGVRQDFPEGSVSLDNLNYTSIMEEVDTGYIDAEVMLQRAKKAQAYGSLGFAAKLLEAQRAGKEIFPVESRGKHYFLMPRTILIRNRRLHMTYFSWNGELWVLEYGWLGPYYSSADRFICPGKLPEAA